MKHKTPGHVPLNWDILSQKSVQEVDWVELDGEKRPAGLCTGRMVRRNRYQREFAVDSGNSNWGWITT